eukprot:4319626-Pyramimonas_sp.AAC.1
MQAASRLNVGHQPCLFLLKAGVAHAAGDLFVAVDDDERLHARRLELLEHARFALDGRVADGLLISGARQARCAPHFVRSGPLALDALR